MTQDLEITSSGRRDFLKRRGCLARPRLEPHRAEWSDPRAGM